MKITLTYPQIQEILNSTRKSIDDLESARADISTYTATQKIYNLTENRQSPEEKRIAFLNTIIDSLSAIVNQVEFEVDVKLGRTKADQVQADLEQALLKRKELAEQGSGKPIIDKAWQENKVEEFK